MSRRMPVNGGDLPPRPRRLRRGTVSKLCLLCSTMRGTLEKALEGDSSFRGSSARFSGVHRQSFSFFAELFAGDESPAAACVRTP